MSLYLLVWDGLPPPGIFYLFAHTVKARSDFKVVPTSFLNQTVVSYRSMFHQNCPGKAFVSRLILLHVQFNKRLVTMSIPNLSEEISKGLRSRSKLQINADRSEADFNDVVTSSMGGEKDLAGRKFTEEEMDIYRTHREACEVRWITSKTWNPMMSCCSIWLSQLRMINYKQGSNTFFVGYNFVLNCTTVEMEIVFRLFHLK